MDVKLIDRDPVRIVYLRHVGPYGWPLAVFWQDTVLPWIARRGLGHRATFGISYDDPKVTAPEQCRCDIGVAVDDDFVAIDDERVTTIPGGRYAVSSFTGTPDSIGAAWTALLREWLPASGMRLDARPMFEYYPADMKTGTDGTFACEITIPVAPS